MAVEVIMPKAGIDMTEGEILALTRSSTMFRFSSPEIS